MKGLTHSSLTLDSPFLSPVWNSLSHEIMPCRNRLINSPVCLTSYFIFFIIQEWGIYGKNIVGSHIDHNSHIFRKSALTKKQKKKYSKTYSKRSKNWKVSRVLEEKTYDYWHSLACRMLQKTVKDGHSIHLDV